MAQQRSRRRTHRSWWQKRTGSMKNWAIVSLIAALAVVSGGLATYAVTRTTPTTANQQPQAAQTPGVVESAAPCTPGDSHLARTAAQLQAGSGVRLAVVGDSTRDENAAGAALIAALRQDLEGADVKSFGRNGSSLEAYTANADLQNQIRAYAPTMIELSIGINDLRQGGSTGQQLTDRLGAYVEALHTDLPNTDILLTVPAALSTQNIGGANFIVGADRTVNPDGMAQAMTTDLRAAFLTTASTHDYVALLDVQEKVTGTTADASPTPKYLRDQLHPTDQVEQRIAALIKSTIGDACS